VFQVSEVISWEVFIISNYVDYRKRSISRSIVWKSSINSYHLPLPVKLMTNIDNMNHTTLFYQNLDKRIIKQYLRWFKQITERLKKIWRVEEGKSL
jgi:hypothetical protein